VYKDVIPDIGALGGIYSALTYSAHDYSLVLACDMSFINRNLLLNLLAVAKKEGADVVIPKFVPEDAWEPFRAIYHKNCLSPIEKQITIGNRRVVSFFPFVSVYSIGETVLRTYDPNLWSFFNINTPEDLEKAEKVAQYYSKI
jgi:molybdopterin-guanine dinucleotide biosynthesis protein A